MRMFPGSAFGIIELLSSEQQKTAVPLSPMDLQIVKYGWLEGESQSLHITYQHSKAPQNESLIIFL